MPPLELFRSPPLHYRMRCEFRVWHDGDDFGYVMFSLNNSEDFLEQGATDGEKGSDGGAEEKKTEARDPSSPLLHHSISC